MKATRYVIEVECDDLGEYDAIFVTSAAKAVVELLGASGVGDFVVRARRHRPGEF